MGVRFGALTSIFAILFLVLVSPLALRWLAGFQGIDWGRLSNIGQTYGAASAVLSAVALIGVSISLFVQARQAKSERVRVVRERHMELMRMALEDPELYLPVMAKLPVSGDKSKQFLFSTMWINYARLGFQLGVLTEQTVREEIIRMSFESEPMRTWWRNVEVFWRPENEPDRRSRRFVKIIDDEYRRALKEGSIAHEINEGHSLEAVTPSGSWRAAAMLACGVTIGYFLRNLFGRKHSRR